jgi:hypothetical protein
MRVLMKSLTALLILSPATGAFAADKIAMAHKGMSKTEAYKICQQEHLSRAQLVRSCIANKMRGG